MVSPSSFHQIWRDGRPPSSPTSRFREAVHVEPLLDDLVGVGRMDGAVGAAMPDRQSRPRAFVVRGAAHESPSSRAGRGGDCIMPFNASRTLLATPNGSLR